MKRKLTSKKNSLFTILHSSNYIFFIAFEIAIGVIVSVGSYVLFLLLSREVLERDFMAFDVNISMFFYSIRTPFLTTLMEWTSAIGLSGTLVISALLVIVLSIRKHAREAVLLSLTLIMGLLLDNSLKFIFARPRPQIAPIQNVGNYSFPSGHAMNAFLFYSLLVYLSFHFFKRKNMRIIAIVFSIIMVLLIGASRVYLGVHYPTDIIAGYIAGFWWFVTVLLLEKTLRFFGIFKEK